MDILYKEIFFGRNLRIIVMIIVLTLMLGSPLWSKGQQPDFISELSDLLTNEGWTVAEVQELIAQDVEWADVKAGNPDVVVLGLQFAKSRDEEIGAGEQALLAIEMAQAAIEMEELGIGELSITLAALNGVRDILTDLQAFHSGNFSGKELGETIQIKMRDQVGFAARDYLQTEISEWDQEMQDNISGDLIPEFPYSDENPNSDPYQDPFF